MTTVPFLKNRSSQPSFVQNYGFKMECLDNGILGNGETNRWWGLGKPSIVKLKQRAVAKRLVTPSSVSRDRLNLP